MQYSWLAPLSTLHIEYTLLFLFFYLLSSTCLCYYSGFHSQIKPCVTSFILYISSHDKRSNSFHLLELFLYGILCLAALLFTPLPLEQRTNLAQHPHTSHCCFESALLGFVSPFNHSEKGKSSNYDHHHYLFFLFFNVFLLRNRRKKRWTGPL